MTIFLGDLHTIETADGVIESFGAGNQAFEVYGGYGAPPINYLTVPTLDRWGVIERDYTLLARPIALQVWSKHAVDLDSYWDNRARLHDLLRPNRGGPMILTIILPNLETRSIAVRANPGFIFAAEPDNNAWLIDQPLDLLAHDPVWFDETEQTFGGTGIAISDLRFPITFPIRFSYSYVSASTGQFLYEGTWETYPVITLGGPYTSAQIVNAVTGATIYMIEPVSNGESRVISLEPGNITVRTQDENLAFGDVDPASDFVRFKIKPDPETPGGLNEISAIMSGGKIGISSITISYQNRYFGV